jgi:hypothetical protein
MVSLAPIQLAVTKAIIGHVNLTHTNFDYSFN